MHASSPATPTTPITLHGRRRRTSRSGIAFGAVYASIIVVCFATATVGNFDLESRALLDTVPFASQAAVVYALGLSGLFPPLRWPVRDALPALPVFVGLYVLGASFGRGAIFG
jgi:hypothetical protein